MKKNSENNRVFLYTTNIDYRNNIAYERIKAVYDVVRFGHSTKNKARIVSDFLNVGGFYENMGSRELLVEYSPEIIKQKIHKFSMSTGYSFGGGYVYAPYVPLNTVAIGRENWGNLEGTLNDDWFEKEYGKISKTIKSRYATVQVNTNFYGTLFPGETPPETGSYRKDIRIRETIWH